MSEPIEVLLQFAFIGVLYLFLLWVARSALKDLGPGRVEAAIAQPGNGRTPQAPLVVAERGGGLRAGASFAVNGTLVIGRSPQSEIQIDDPFASARHAEIVDRDGVCYLEDLGSTNGTYLNGRRVRSTESLRADDRIRIGDTELRYRQ